MDEKCVVGGVGRVKVNALLLSEALNLRIFLQVLLRLVLHVVIEGHDDLLGVVNLLGTNGHELGRDGP